jgi:Protein of unknown function (DUF2569)
MSSSCSQCASTLEDGAAVCLQCGNAAATSAPVPIPEYVPPAFHAPALFASAIEESNSPYEGIGGGLILFAIGLVFSPLIYLVRLVKTYLPLFTNVRMQTYLEFHQALHALLVFEVITNIVLLAMLVWLNHLFFNKKRAFPTFMILFYVLACLLQSIDHFGAVAVMQKSLSSLMLVRVFVAAAIWIPYFLISRRVKVTFVH